MSHIERLFYFINLPIRSARSNDNNVIKPAINIIIPNVIIIFTFSPPSLHHRNS